MKKFKKRSLLFCTGAVGYCLLELLWRGRTHWSMAAAGGVSFVLLSELFQKLRGFSLLVRCAAGGGVITGVELVFGLVFNRALHLHVWDYSALPGNLFGQICPLYSFFWCLLCVPIAFLTERIGPRKTLPGA